MARKRQSEHSKAGWEKALASVVVVVFASLGIGVLMLGGFALVATYWDVIWSFLSRIPMRDAIIYVVSWVILLLVSVLSTKLIVEILHQSRWHRSVQRANYIAVMIGIVLTLFLFKQPFLDQVFGGHSSGDFVRWVLFGGGLGGGWVVWYLRQLKVYGEFFHVLLLTLVTGFCWYARLTAPEQVQLTAVAFLLGSLFRIATDYLKEAYGERTTQRQSAETEEH